MVKRTFVAQHFLTVPNCGKENEWHSHTFTLELTLSAPTLNADGYLVDIVKVTEVMDSVIEGFRDKTMNDLPAFAGLNPSIEHFARIISDQIAPFLEETQIETMHARLWEDDLAWAAYHKELKGQGKNG